MMFPFSTITNYLQTSTRSIARELKKQIELKIIGDEIELDKHVLEALKDPLIHLIRNSIDHGIETPEERVKKGKAEKGHITIEVLPPREQNVVIRISDDGQGIDLERLKNAALQKQLVTEEELNSYTEAQVLSLIFKSGFSTKDKVSRVSGRGLGMAVVM
jgi:two-component system chemotaxis sensor kinase CheA